MTNEQCIAILRKGMELDLDRDTHDAMAYAADFLEKHPIGGSKSYYYTFGSDPLYPFGRDEYIIIHAETGHEADLKFMAHFPCRPGSSVLNCAFVYDEAEWEKCKPYYPGKEPTVVIE